MKSRKLVLRTLEFDNPCRLPRHLWLLPWAQIHYPGELRKIQSRFPDDIRMTPGFFKEEIPTCGDPHKIGDYTDEWGCVFMNKQDGIIGEVKNPLIQSWSDLDRVKTPEALLSFDIQKVNEFCRSTDLFVLAGCCPRPFERIQFLRGTENLMIDLALEPQRVKDLIKIVHDYHTREYELWSKTDADGMMFMDDWGSQKSLLISPDMWREFFKPLYRDYIDIAHAAGKKVFMHSDGCIKAIIPDLIELGLDALNSQIFCMGLQDIGKAFAGKITFWGDFDRQNLLPYGSREEIVQAVETVCQSLYCNGGLIAQVEFGPGAKPENVFTALETFDRFFLHPDDYKVNCWIDKL